MLEAEVKFLYADAQALSRRIATLGATQLGEERITKVAYFTPPFGRKDDRFRLRLRGEEDLEPEITYKRMLRNREVKLAQEHDLHYQGTYDAAYALLEDWGCRRRRGKRDLGKMRESYLLGVPIIHKKTHDIVPVRLEIDFLDHPKDAPPIFEIERKSDDPLKKSILALREAARMLDLDWKERSVRSTAAVQSMYLQNLKK